jgi:hypothetical protein
MRRMTGEDALDATARSDLAAERRRVADALSRMPINDAQAFAAEVERHIDRVQQILDAHSRRQFTRAPCIAQ